MKKILTPMAHARSLTLLVTLVLIISSFSFAAAPPPKPPVPEPLPFKKLTVTINGYSDKIGLSFPRGASAGWAYKSKSESKSGTVNLSAKNLGQFLQGTVVMPSILIEEGTFDVTMNFTYVDNRGRTWRWRGMGTIKIPAEATIATVNMKITRTQER